MRAPFNCSATLTATADAPPPHRRYARRRRPLPKRAPRLMECASIPEDRPGTPHRAFGCANRPLPPQAAIGRRPSDTDADSAMAARDRASTTRTRDADVGICRQRRPDQTVQCRIQPNRPPAARSSGRHRSTRQWTTGRTPPGRSRGSAGPGIGHRTANHECGDADDDGRPGR